MTEVGVPIPTSVDVDTTPNGCEYCGKKKTPAHYCDQMERAGVPRYVEEAEVAHSCTYCKASMKSLTSLHHCEMMRILGIPKYSKPKVIKPKVINTKPIRPPKLYNCIHCEMSTNVQKKYDDHTCFGKKQLEDQPYYTKHKPGFLNHGDNATHKYGDNGNDTPKEGWTCQACNTTILNEKVFLNHYCSKQERIDQSNSVHGQTAYRYCLMWIKKRHRGHMSMETFTKSAMFTNFFKFAIWTQRVHIPDVDRYVSYMIMKTFNPNVWTMDATYVQFINHIDLSFKVDDHIDNTVRTLGWIARKYDCELSEALNQVTISKLMSMITQRRLSPWVLIYMKSFQKIVHELPDVDKRHCTNTLNPSKWKEHIALHQKGSSEIKQLCEALNI